MLGPAGNETFVPETEGLVSGAELLLGLSGPELAGTGLLMRTSKTNLPAWSG